MVFVILRKDFSQFFIALLNKYDVAECPLQSFDEFLDFFVLVQKGLIEKWFEGWEIELAIFSLHLIDFLDLIYIVKKCVVC